MFTTNPTANPTAISTRRALARKQLLAALATGSVLLVWEGGVAVAQDKPQKGSGELVIPESKPGEADFDKAIQMRINVDSLDKLNEIVILVDSAIRKGLSPASDEAAKTFLASVLKQRVEFGIRDLQESRRSQARVSKALGEFIEDLSRSIELDPSLIEAYVIKAAILRDRQEFGEARDVLSDGIKVMEPVLKSKPKSLEVREKLAKLYATRASMQEETDDQIADMEKSYEINPNDADILKRYLLLLQSQQKFDKVLQTLEKALASEPENIEFIASKITILLQSGKIDDALAFSTKSIDAATDDEIKAALLRQRALIHTSKENADAAKQDLDASLALIKNNVPTMLLRARLAVGTGDFEGGLKDVEAILEIEEDNADAILLRADIATDSDRYAEAIDDYKSLINRIQPGPLREELQLKLGLAYWRNNNHKQALRVIDQVTRANDGNWQAYRLRGEILLSQGEHGDAVSAYEKAVRMMPEAVNEDIRSSLLNNLSWLLATSPEDGVRDGERALELGLKACELTNYAEAHILSTLAAAYAEKGDFEKAIEFATKAVDIGKKEESEQLEQLEGELKSYQEKKPWREKQEAKPTTNKPAIPAPSGAGT